MYHTWTGRYSTLGAVGLTKYLGIGRGGLQAGGEERGSAVEEQSRVAFERTVEYEQQAIATIEKAAVETGAGNDAARVRVIDTTVRRSFSPSWEMRHGTQTSRV